MSKRRRHCFDEDDCGNPVFTEESYMGQSLVVYRDDDPYWTDDNGKKLPKFVCAYDGGCGDGKHLLTIGAATTPRQAFNDAVKALEAMLIAARDLSKDKTAFNAHIKKARTAWHQD